MWKKIFLITPILLIYIAALPKAAAAQTSPSTQQFLEVNPIIQDLQLTPGQPTSYPLTITNKGDKPVGFHVDVTGIDPTNNTSQNPPQNSPLLSWITVTPTDLIVPPHERTNFTVTINTPHNAPTSGYYATLFLTPFISNPLKNSGPIILERVGTLLLTTVGHLNYDELAKKVHLDNFHFDSLWQPQTISFSLSNTYFTHFIAKPRVVVSTLLDHQTITWPEERHVLPGTTRSWSIPITTHWYTLYSSASLTVSIGDGKTLRAQTIYINYPLLIGIVLACCLALLVLKRTRQLKKALRILFTGRE